MNTERFMIASFRSRQAVLRVDGQLRRMGVRTQIVSTPRAVAVGCGLSIRFDERDLNAVRRLSQAETSTYLGIYRVENVNGRVLVQPVM